MWVSMSSGMPVVGHVMLLGSPSTLKKPEGTESMHTLVVGLLTVLVSFLCQNRKAEIPSPRRIGIGICALGPASAEDS